MSESRYWERWRTARPSRRRLLLSAGAGGAGIAAAAAVGCGDDDDDETSEPAAATGGQPKRGGNLVYLNSVGDQPNFDVQASSSGSLMRAGSGLAYTKLVRMKTGPDVTASKEIIPQPLAAASWEQPDPSTFVFKINPAAKWHNIAPVNGRQLTAQDVVYSVERQLALKVNQAFMPGVTRVTAVDPATVRITLNKANADFISALCAPHNKIVAREAVEVKGDLKEGPVIGASAWIFKEWTPNSVMRFVRNPDYWRKDQYGTQLPYADSLELPLVRDQSTALAAFRTKQTLFLGLTSGDPSVEDAEALKRSNPDVVVVHEKPGSSGSSYTLRTDIAPTNDVRVRTAVRKAIDILTLIATVGGPQTSVASAGMPAFNSKDQMLSEEEARRLMARDVAGARQLLKQAGVSNWSPEFWVSNQAANLTTSGELIQANLKEVGINATIKVADNNRIAAWRTARDLPFVVSPGSSYIYGPNTFLYATHYSTGDSNVSRINDAELDRLIDAQAAELKDTPRRNDLLKQIQRRIIELGGTVPLYVQSSVLVHHSNIHNLWAGRYAEPEHHGEIWMDQ